MEHLWMNSRCFRGDIRTNRLWAHGKQANLNAQNICKAQRLAQTPKVVRTCQMKRGHESRAIESNNPKDLMSLNNPPCGPYIYLYLY